MIRSLWILNHFPHLPITVTISNYPKRITVVVLDDYFDDSSSPINEQTSALPHRKQVVPRIKRLPPKYLLVERTQLMELFKHCPDCGYMPEKANASIDHYLGTACKISLWCYQCDKYISWYSQKKIGNTEKFSANVEIPTAASIVPIQYSSLQQLADLIDIPFISRSTFHRHAKLIWPEVHKEHDRIQDQLIEEIIEKQENVIRVLIVIVQLSLQETFVRLAGDAQFDSRGYSAEFASCGLMDADRKTMLHTECVHKSETNGNSGLMENEGLVRGLQFLESRGIKIHSLTTDRHKQVIKTMESRFKHIRHFYDPWHLIKGVASNLRLVRYIIIFFHNQFVDL